MSEQTEENGGAGDNLNSLVSANYRTVKTCETCRESERETSGIGMEFLVCSKFNECVDEQSVCDSYLGH